MSDMRLIEGEEWYRVQHAEIVNLRAEIARLQAEVERLHEIIWRSCDPKLMSKEDAAKFEEIARSAMERALEQADEK